MQVGLPRLRELRRKPNGDADLKMCLMFGRDATNGTIRYDMRRTWTSDVRCVWLTD